MPIGLSGVARLGGREEPHPRPAPLPEVRLLGDVEAPPVEDWRAEVSAAQEWADIAEQAEASGDIHALRKEIRLLKHTIERQQARLVAMDALLEQGSPELETARAMYPHLVKLCDWVKHFLEVNPAPVRGGMMLRGDLRDSLLHVVFDLKSLTKKLEESRGRPCEEPGCVLKPSLGYGSHWHTDGHRQWKTVETNRGTRRFKRGAW